MLAHIHIKDLGIIDELEVDFDKGLNILTGETGAGKTLIIDAINMILGNKVSKDLIRTGASKAIAEALFFIDSVELKDRLKEKDIDTDEIIITRELLENGRSVAKINGRLVTISELAEVGGLLVDLHGQHDNQSLLNVKNHIGVLDNFAGDTVKKLLSEYSKLYIEKKEINERIEKLGGNPEQRAKNMEFLKFQIDEIEDANLSEGEDELLQEKRKILVNAEKIIKSVSFSSDCISGESGVCDRLQLVISKLEEVEDFDEKYKKYLTGLSEAYYQIEEISRDMECELDRVNVDENELNKVDERLDTLFKTKKKYGKSINEIFENLAKMQNEYDELKNSEKLLDENLNKLRGVEEKMRLVAEKISVARKNAGRILEARLGEVLQQLEMPKSRFSINVVFAKENKFYSNGMDEVEILFSSNLGESLKPLSKIASGGEVSRIMLALKNVLADADIIPVLIFDEIDVGISGKAGFAVGEKMAEIAQSKQVICVTHLASIAAKGNSNFFISKITENDRTVTRIRKLDENETINEIARIISGGNITETALAHAKEIRDI